MVSPLSLTELNAQQQAAQSLLKSISERITDDLRKDRIGWRLCLQLLTDIDQAYCNGWQRSIHP